MFLMYLCIYLLSSCIYWCMQSIHINTELLRHDRIHHSFRFYPLYEPMYNSTGVKDSICIHLQLESACCPFKTKDKNSHCILCSMTLTLRNTFWQDGILIERPRRFLMPILRSSFKSWHHHYTNLIRSL